MQQYNSTRKISWLSSFYGGLENDPAVTVQNTERGRLYFCGQASLPEDFIIRAVESHIKQVQIRGSSLIKLDRKRRVSRFQDVGGQSVIVKEFVNPGLWGRWAADCRSFTGALRAMQAGLPVVSYLAMLKCPDGKAYIFMEDLGDRDLYTEIDSAISRGDTDRRNAVIDKMVALISSLHLDGVYHGDLKTANFMVLNAGDDVALKLIDLDDMHFSSSVTCRRKLKNLRQILGTLPPRTGQKDKERILHIYAKETGLSEEDQVYFFNKLKN